MKLDSGVPSTSYRQHADAESLREQRYKEVLTTLTVAFGVGMAGIVVHALQFPRPVIPSVIGVAIMVAGASLLIGGFFGFVFGLPRFVGDMQNREVATADGDENVVEGRERTGPRAVFAPSTNLTQISDWLTKVLVGVGLTQLVQLPSAVDTLAQRLAPAFGGAPSSGPAAAAMAIFFTLLGFLYGYLWMSLFGARFIAQSAQDLTAAAAAKAVVVVSGRIKQEVTASVEAHVSEQAQHDAQALALMQRQLESVPGSPPISEQELTAAFVSARRDTRFVIFLRADQQRRDNWRAADTKTVMERTIPVFRALVAAEPDNYEYHRKLGYALKDKQQPDWRDAEAEFTRALQIRGPARGWGDLYVEFNRAICRIEQDAPFLRGEPSGPEERDEILADLRVVARSPLLPQLKDLGPIPQWLEVNKDGLSAADALAFGRPTSRHTRDPGKHNHD